MCEAYQVIYVWNLIILRIFVREYVMWHYSINFKYILKEEFYFVWLGRITMENSKGILKNEGLFRYFVQLRYKNAFPFILFMDVYKNFIILSNVGGEDGKFFYIVIYIQVLISFVASIS